MGGVITVHYLGKDYKLSLPADATVQQLSLSFKEKYAPAIDLQTVKVLARGKTLRPADTLAAAGIRSGGKVALMASAAADVDAVRRAKDLPGMAGFDHELQREQRRQAGGAAAAGPPAGPYTFQRFEAWQAPGLQPSPSEALKLLHQLAADAGILGVMRQHQYSVGLLSEMPPEGKVGVSPVCILGVNINRGQEISLRLRTDDLKGAFIRLLCLWKNKRHAPTKPSLSCTTSVSLQAFAATTASGRR